MPAPCTNCVRFHYGPCHEAPKFCRVCGGINHIERYCPNNKNTIHRVRGEPLAGTYPWQEMHGLHLDPDLRHKVLQSLKTSPGTAIHVNGICIYQGYEKHFVKEEEKPRGRTLEERMGQRRRSRSPNYGRLSRSPPRNDKLRREPLMRRPDNTYRQRSPVCTKRRRTPSPYRHASPPSFYHPQPRFVPRSPRFASGSNAVVFEASRSSGSYQNQSHVSQGRLADNMGSSGKLGYLPDAPSPQQGLREISGNVQVFATPPKAQQIAGQISPPLAGDTMVDDPHFVLGIPKGAGHTEIMNAFRDRMQEVETERALELDIDMELNNDYDNSIHILNAAKNQLLGIRSGSID